MITKSVLESVAKIISIGNNEKVRMHKLVDNVTTGHKPEIPDHHFTLEKMAETDTKHSGAIPICLVRYSEINSIKGTLRLNWQHVLCRF